MQLYLETKAVGPEADAAHRVESVAVPRRLLSEEDLRAVGERQKFSPVHRKLRRVTQDRPALALSLVRTRLETQRVRPLLRRGDPHPPRAMDEIAQQAGASFRGEARDGEPRQDGQGAVIGMEVE